ncbi:MAG: hypothetical protein FJ276_34395 [Planctomycetes bacterium]|nr:hypothetical protein [Planctomycetota bacterium]
MIPGPDQIIACPHCNTKAKYMTLMSGNDCGARVWTDGKMVAPMLPQPPEFVKCSGCGGCYWLEDAEEVGTVDPFSPHRSAVQPVEEPSANEYFAALEKGDAPDREREKRLRVLAWWRSNDAFRHTPPTRESSVATVSAACKENLETLKDLLDEQQEVDCLLKAEVLRELGQFASAKQLLGRVTSADYALFVHQVLPLCDAEDAWVRELHLDD